MKNKTWIVGMLVVALALLAASVGFAADQDRVKDFDALHQQMLELKKEILNKHVAYGDMTAERAAAIESRMTERYEQMKANGFTGYCGGNGRGPGQGQGQGRMGGGIGRTGDCPYWQESPAQ